MHDGSHATGERWIMTGTSRWLLRAETERSSFVGITEGNDGGSEQRYRTDSSSRDAGDLFDLATALSHPGSPPAERIGAAGYICQHRYDWTVNEVIDRSDVIHLAAKLFCGFGDRTRLAILVLLASGERRVSDVVESLDGSQGNISGHLRCLKDCGLVADRRSGREVYYRIAHDEVLDLLRSAEQLLAVTGHHIDLCPNYRPASS